jgi:hypothetical protein
MIIGVISDVHLEFRKICWRLFPGWLRQQVRLYDGSYVTGDILGDREEVLLDVLCVCGDVCPLSSHQREYVDFFAHVSQMAKTVLVVLGNHEFYGTTIEEGYSTAKLLVGAFPNVHLLERDKLQIDNVCFYGTTLWSRVPDQMMEKAGWAMNDFSHIVNHDPRKMNQLFADSYDWLKKAVVKDRNADLNLVQVILTHHLPSFELIAEQYKNNSDGLNCCYATEIIGDILPDFWLCGHSHQRTDTIIEDGVRCIIHCRGYKGETNDNHNLVKVFDV